MKFNTIFCDGDFIQFIHEGGLGDIMFSVFHSWRIFSLFSLYVVKLWRHWSCNETSYFILRHKYYFFDSNQQFKEDVITALESTQLFNITQVVIAGNIRIGIPNVHIMSYCSTLWVFLMPCILTNTRVYQFKSKQLSCWFNFEIRRI